MPFEPNIDIDQILENNRASQHNASPVFDFRLLVETAGVGITQAATGSGRIHFANPAFCKMLGYTELTSGDITFLEITHPEDIGTNTAEHHKLLTGKIDSYTIDKRYIRKDGGLVWARVTATALREIGGDVLWTMGVMRDITREKLLEHKLDIAEELCGIATWNRAITSGTSCGSSAYNALFGFPASTPYPTVDEFIARVHPDDRPTAAAAVQSALNGGGYKDEFRIVRPDGEVRHLKTAAACIRDSAGEITNFIGATVDVTEFKTMEADLREATATGHLNRVEDYIEANVGQPMSIESLASVLNVSERSIFRYFKQARDCTPMEFVKSVRLRHAQHMLQRPDDTMSVAAVAFRCGFHNLGHFAKDYRQAFGELPSESLNRARRQAS